MNECSRMLLNNAENVLGAEQSTCSGLVSKERPRCSLDCFPMNPALPDAEYVALLPQLKKCPSHQQQCSWKLPFESRCKTFLTKSERSALQGLLKNNLPCRQPPPRLTYLTGNRAQDSSISNLREKIGAHRHAYVHFSGPIQPAVKISPNKLRPEGNTLPARAVPQRTMQPMPLKPFTGAMVQSVLECGATCLTSSWGDLPLLPPIRKPRAEINVYIPRGEDNTDCESLGEDMDDKLSSWSLQDEKSNHPAQGAPGREATGPGDSGNRGSLAPCPAAPRGSEAGPGRSWEAATDSVQPLQGGARRHVPGRRGRPRGVSAAPPAGRAPTSQAGGRWLLPGRDLSHGARLRRPAGAAGPLLPAHRGGEADGPDLGRALPAAEVPVCAVCRCLPPEGVWLQARAGAVPAGGRLDRGGGRGPAGLWAPTPAGDQQLRAHHRHDRCHLHPAGAEGAHSHVRSGYGLLGPPAAAQHPRKGEQGQVQV